MMTMEKAPYGSWKSPITSSSIVESAIRLGEIVIDQETLYWSESRPSEKGRSVVVKLSHNKAQDVNPEPYNVRTRVHEYGGGSFTAHQGTLYFSNFKDQHFYSYSADGTFKTLAGADSKRYANPVFDSKRVILYAIEEEHLSSSDVKNSLVTIDAKGRRSPKVIHEGHDFYASPTLSPDNAELAFITWDHPRMPWDGSELWLGKLSIDGTLESVKQIAGGPNESIFQPRFAPDGTLYFISDRDGFWNLYRLDGTEVEACFPMEAEFGYPQWVFGLSRYDFVPSSDGVQIACIYTMKGIDHLGLLNVEKKKLDELPLPYTTYVNLAAASETLYFLAGSPTEVQSLVAYHLPSKHTEIIRKSKDLKLDPSAISIPETIEFPTEKGETAFGFYYPPKNKDFQGLSDEKPPLIVKSHGGPSAHAMATLNLEVQFWTSRGIGVLDVNYGGSTGFGRAYRERLKGNWGTVDVDDCVNGALFLAKRGDVDKNRLAIKGGSAGGYTTLAALTFRDIFKAGVSYYGVSDLEALVKDTHKFESHYLEGLVGPYPKEKKRYQELSPIYHTEKLSCPVILLQGAEDKVVPPSQAEMMVDALKKQGIPVSYILFENEQHGFRDAKNIQRAVEAELEFYSSVFQFTTHYS